MPIDPMMLNAMLGTFQKMVEDCKTQNISGEDFDNMCETLTRMEQLGQEHSDMNAFNGQVMQENLYGKFSEHYSKALANQAKESAGGSDGSYDDGALLAQTIQALKQTIQSLQQSYQESIELAKGKNVEAERSAGLDYLERNTEKGFFKATGGIENLREESEKGYQDTIKERPNAFDSSVEVEILNNPDKIIKPIQNLIDLAEQPGMTLPKFLTIQIEKGLDRAMEGSVTTLDGLEFSLEFIKASPPSPHHIKKEEKKIELFKKLSSENKFGVPNWTEIKYANDEIDRDLEPKIREWDTIKKRWDDMIWDLSFWSLSYCDFAPYIKPWVMAKDPVASTKKTQAITPGIFREREKLMQKYFGMSFMDIFKHPTFEWEVKNNFISYSQEFVTFLIEKVLPLCQPFQSIPSNIIEERATFFKKDRFTDDKEGNPESHLAMEKFRDFYDSKFGEGRYTSKFGQIEKSSSVAKPWNWEEFKYKN